MARSPRTPRIARIAPWPWAAAGAAVGLASALIVFAPAGWLASGVADATDGRVVLAQARGTVWRGSAQLVLTGGAGSTDAAALPGRLTWNLQPRWDGVLARLRPECCADQPIDVRAHLRVGGLRVAVGDSLSQWPAHVTAGLGTPWNTLQLDGDVQLRTQGLSVEWAAGRLAIAGRAEFMALRMASRLSTLRPMGSYRITLQGGTPASLAVDTLEGSLQLSGAGQWVGSRLRFRGEASATPEREAALANLLNIIGRRSGARSIISIG